MAKSIITQDGNLVNYNNLITIIVDKRPLPNETVDTFCLIGVDTTNETILLYHSDNLDDVERVKPTKSNASSTVFLGSPNILRITSRFSYPVRFA